LLDGLDAARAPLASLSDEIERFDGEVAKCIRDKPADDVRGSLEKIRTELVACRKALKTSGDAWNALLAKVRQQDDAKNDQAVLADQQEAEKLLSTFLDRLGQSVMAIQKQVQSIGQTGAEDMTRRIVIQDALRKRATALVSARVAFANAGADVIPMSNQRLDACARQVRQLREGLNEREKMISAGMEKRASDQASESREKRLAALREQVKEQAQLREQALSDVQRLAEQLVKVQEQQRNLLASQQTAALAKERLRHAEARLADVQARMARSERTAATGPTSGGSDRAYFSGAFPPQGLANPVGLARKAGGWALFVFAMTWAVILLVTGGRQGTRAASPPSRRAR